MGEERLAASTEINKAPQPAFLKKTPKELNIGTWESIHTIEQTTTLIEILDRFLTHRISALPVVSSEGKVVDIYAKFDVLNLVADTSFDNLDITVKEVLSRRSQWFEGVRNCTDTDSLEAVIDLLVKAEVHRLVIVNIRNEVKGIVSLSDILSFLVFKSEGTIRPFVFVRLIVLFQK
ncbi:unnamed protein product [Soboliphyme baturini]|uniref:CBS domain-containing protein n=1 Tax=Soboliphyme baturini TaxID=241478 RepID=A0A183J2F8_9BILA|nr:unnamed protein product [Soboliphyme baturini]